MKGHSPGRRRLLRAACAGLLGGVDASALAEGAGDLSRTVLTLPVDEKTIRRALVLSPRAPRRGGYPVLVLLHGLAETASEGLGLTAWSDRYGLVDAASIDEGVARLAATLPKRSRPRSRR